MEDPNGVDHTCLHDTKDDYLEDEADQVTVCIDLHSFPCVDRHILCREQLFS